MGFATCSSFVIFLCSPPHTHSHVFEHIKSIVTHNRFRVIHTLSHERASCTCNSTWARTEHTSSLRVRKLQNPSFPHPSSSCRLHVWLTSAHTACRPETGFYTRPFHSLLFLALLFFFLVACPRKSFRKSLQKWKFPSSRKNTATMWIPISTSRVVTGDKKESEGKRHRSLIFWSSLLSLVWEWVHEDECCLVIWLMECPLNLKSGSHICRIVVVFVNGMSEERKGWRWWRDNLFISNKSLFAKQNFALSSSRNGCFEFMQRRATFRASWTNTELSSNQTKRQKEWGICAEIVVTLSPPVSLLPPGDSEEWVNIGSVNKIPSCLPILFLCVCMFITGFTEKFTHQADEQRGREEIEHCVHTSRTERNIRHTKSIYWFMTFQHSSLFPCECYKIGIVNPFPVKCNVQETTKSKRREFLMVMWKNQLLAIRNSSLKGVRFLQETMAIALHHSFHFVWKTSGTDILTTLYTVRVCMHHECVEKLSFLSTSRRSLLAKGISKVRSRFMLCMRKH